MMDYMATNAQHLYSPMNCNLLVDIMLKEMDDIQFTVMTFPSGNYKFSDQQMIDANVMKLKRTGAYTPKPLRNVVKPHLPNNLGKSSNKSSELNVKSS